MKNRFDIKKIKEKLFRPARQMFVFTLPQKEEQRPVIRTHCDWTSILDERLSDNWCDRLRF